MNTDFSTSIYSLLSFCFKKCIAERIIELGQIQSYRTISISLGNKVKSSGPNLFTSIYSLKGWHIFLENTSFQGKCIVTEELQFSDTQQFQRRNSTFHIAGRYEAIFSATGKFVLSLFLDGNVQQSRPIFRFCRVNSGHP